MQQKKSKKIFIYLLLLITVGSIHNITLNNLSIYNIKNIKVIGLNENDNSVIKKKLYDLKLGNILFINKKKINKIIDSNTNIEDFKVFKKYPSTLDIKIKKTKFLAKINRNNKIYFVGSNGKLSNGTHEIKQLPFIFGKPDIKDFLQFKKTIDISKFSFQDVKNLYFFPSERWDIELKNNIIIKLPKKNLKIKLDYLFEFLNNKSLQNINIIDLRVKNQIILNG